MTPENLQATASGLREIVRAAPTDKELEKANDRSLAVATFTGMNVVTLALALLFEHLADPQATLPEDTFILSKN